MDLPDFLVDHPDGEIRLTGHRIGLYHFVYHYNEGYSAEMIACQYPTLSLAHIHKVIAFNVRTAPKWMRMWRGIE